MLLWVKLHCQHVHEHQTQVMNISELNGLHLSKYFPRVFKPPLATHSFSQGITFRFYLFIVPKLEDIPDVFKSRYYTESLALEYEVFKAYSWRFFLACKNQKITDERLMFYLPTCLLTYLNLVTSVCCDSYLAKKWEVETVPSWLILPISYGHFFHMPTGIISESN